MFGLCLSAQAAASAILVDRGNILRGLLFPLGGDQSRVVLRNRDRAGRGIAVRGIVGIATEEVAGGAGVAQRTVETLRGDYHVRCVLYDGVPACLETVLADVKTAPRLETALHFSVPANNEFAFS